MAKPRNSKGRYHKVKNPRKYLMRLTEDEKQLIEVFRQDSVRFIENYQKLIKEGR